MMTKRMQFPRIAKRYMLPMGMEIQMCAYSSPGIPTKKKVVISTYDTLIIDMTHLEGSTLRERDATLVKYEYLENHRKIVFEELLLTEQRTYVATIQ